MDETPEVMVDTISLRRLLQVLPPLPPQAGPRHLRRAQKALAIMMKQRRIRPNAMGGATRSGATGGRADGHR